MPLTSNNAKLWSIFLIGIGSFVVGIVPACFIKKRHGVQKKLLLSALLCFGGGVLLATSLLHMLPETRESLPHYAELILSCGFFILYFVDEIAHYYWIKNGSSNSATDTNFFGRKKSVYRYGSVIPTAPPPPPPTLFNENENIFSCHGTHNEPCAESNAGHIGLAIALTIHSVLEVLLLVGAVISHKFVVAFCLGLELAESSGSLCSYICAMILFCGGSSVGIAIGMMTFEINPFWENNIMPTMQGLAAGTLLYVTVSEVLPRERAKWHNSPKRSAGIVQFLSVISGFTIMYFINEYIEHNHH
ncbi:hypothetical protein HCN44_009535 [Aphidius gifuensis]|uniref:Uncharacterized protein n=1 Tax=Aphidius gifuensis TaxID=684658 RepID=A0A834Y7K4_APHGI|nr:hypothetical protein HCN44_009535 [Aphidius gifuensis]